MGRAGLAKAKGKRDRHVLTRIGTGARRTGGLPRPAPRGRRDTGRDGTAHSPSPTEPRRVGVSAAERRDEQSTKQPAEQGSHDHDATGRLRSGAEGMCARPRVAQQLRRQRMAGPGRTRVQPQHQASSAAATPSASASDQIDRLAMGAGVVCGHAAWPVAGIVGLDCAAFSGPHVLFCFLAHRVQ